MVTSNLVLWPPSLRRSGQRTSALASQQTIIMAACLLACSLGVSVGWSSCRHLARCSLLAVRCSLLLPRVSSFLAAVTRVFCFPRGSIGIMPFDVCICVYFRPHHSFQTAGFCVCVCGRVFMLMFSHSDTRNLFTKKIVDSIVSSPNPNLLKYQQDCVNRIGYHASFRYRILLLSHHSAIASFCYRNIQQETRHVYVSYSIRATCCRY